MLFETKVAGIPCQCGVHHYLPGTPASTWGRDEDADEGTDEEFEFHILDMNGKRALWLESKLTDADRDRLLEEYHVTLLEAKHMIDYFDGVLPIFH
jgi:hypothetical protein